MHLKSKRTHLRHNMKRYPAIGAGLLEIKSCPFGTVASWKGRRPIPVTGDTDKYSTRFVSKEILCQIVLLARVVPA